MEDISSEETMLTAEELLKQVYQQLVEEQGKGTLPLSREIEIKCSEGRISGNYCEFFRYTALELVEIGVRSWIVGQGRVEGHAWNNYSRDLLAIEVRPESTLEELAENIPEALQQRQDFSQSIIIALTSGLLTYGTNPAGEKVRKEMRGFFTSETVQQRDKKCYYSPDFVLKLVAAVKHALSYHAES